MNVSDAPSNGFERKGRPSGRARGSTVRIVIRREDHIGDGLGFIFLESAGGDHDGSESCDGFSDLHDTPLV